MSESRFDEFCGQFPRCEVICPFNLLPTGCRQAFEEIENFLKTELEKED